MKKSTFSSLKKSMQEGLDIVKGKSLDGIVITEIIIREPKVFSARAIKKLRVSMGISQSMFAQIIGVSVNAIRNWEQGRNSPSTMARRFLELIENDPEQFLGQAEEMQIIERHQERA